MACNTDTSKLWFTNQQLAAYTQVAKHEEREFLPITAYHEQQVCHEEDCHLRSSLPKNVHQCGRIMDDGVELVQ